MMTTTPDEHTLEFLLAFDGRVHSFEKGYWIKFEIKRVQASAERPHGLRYSFTLHGPDGTRLLGFDNAHAPPANAAPFEKKPRMVDHWHRTSTDAGTPYAFTTADQLLVDFHKAVMRELAFRGVDLAVTGESD